MHLIDKTILAQSSKHLVLQQASGVTFADASCLQLNRVDIASGLTAPFLRAVYDGPDQVLVFDVRDVCRSLRESLKAAPDRDVQGLIYYALRFAFTGSEQALDHIRDQQIDCIDLSILKAAA